MAIESVYPSLIDYKKGFEDKKEKVPALKSVTIKVRGKSTWTESVISDMLDSAAKREAAPAPFVAQDSYTAKVMETLAEDGKAVIDSYVSYERDYYHQI